MTLRRQNAVRRRVIDGALRTLVALATLVVAGSAVPAQQGPATDQHRWATALTLDLGSLPGDFDTRCGSSSKGSEPSFGGGLAVLFRPRRWFVATLDTRVSDVPYSNACKTTAPIAHDGYHITAREFPNGVAGKPLVRNAIHIGVETPPGALLLRATVGGGMIWTGSSTPFASVAIGGGTGGRGARFYWEVETSGSAVRVRETYTGYLLDQNGVTLLPSKIVSYVEHPLWTALHVGLELPVGSSP
jgi:hypothetical protein